MFEHLLLVYNGMLLGASEIICTVIGNSIEENKVTLAKRYFKVILLFNLGWNYAVAITLILAGKTIFVLFTSDLEL